MAGVIPDAHYAQHALDCRHCTYRTVPAHRDMITACDELMERGWDYVVPITVNGVDGVVGLAGPWSVPEDLSMCAL